MQNDFKKINLIPILLTLCLPVFSLDEIKCDGGADDFRTQILVGLGNSNNDAADLRWYLQTLDALVQEQEQLFQPVTNMFINHDSSDDLAGNEN